MSANRKVQILDAVTISSGLTAQEYNRILQEQYKDFPRDTARRRLPELEKLGYVAKHTPRECSVTGKTAQTWISTTEGLRKCLRIQFRGDTI